MNKNTGRFIFFVLIAVSCLDEPDCFNLNNNIIGVSFKKMLDGKADTVAFNLVTATGTDSVFLAFGQVNGLSLPLNYFENQTSFLLEGIDKAYNLDLSYSAKAQFVSEECGARFVLSDLKILNHNFDSIRFLNATPGTGKGTNIEVYRCPRFDMIKVAFRKLRDTTSVKDTVVVSIDTNYPATIVMSGDSVESVKIPLNLAATSSTITFTFENEAPKTLTLSYNSQDSTFFDRCGSQSFLSKLKAVSTTLDSVRIVTDTIQDPPRLNVEIIR